MPDITFVDANDQVIGHGSKEDALEHGIVHRIVRIFIFNSKGELLIQKRALNVESLPGRWDQSAAGHVDAGENYLQAARREVQEELGLDIVELKEKGKFFAEETDEPRLKRRFNKMYTGVYDGPIEFGRMEVSEIKWIGINELAEWMNRRPRDFTEAFINAFNRYFNESDK